MSQLNVNQILKQIRVQQDQIAALQAIIVEGRRREAAESNIEYIKHTGGMFSGPKTMICSNHITIKEFDYSY